MPRYIDAEVLYRKLHEWDKAIDEAIRILNKMPTADVVKIVRCKDCKFYSVNGHCGVLGFCEPDEFCSRGEREREEKRRCRGTLMLRISN